MRRFLSLLTVLLLAATAAWSAAASDDAAANSIAIGIDAYRQGSPEASVEALSEALQGRLSSRQAAKAHYYRGLAYRALGKPGQAIADLDAAIAQVNGLSLGKLMEAEDNRTAAYAEAGITAEESVVPAKADKGPQISARTPQPQSFLTTTSIDAREPAPSPWNAAAIVLPPAPAGVPTPFATAVLPGAVAPSATAATIVPPPAPAGQPTPFATAVLPGAVAPSAAAGRIHLQVARVQTQSEAYALAVRLVSQHGAEFSSDMLRIERAVSQTKEPVFLVRLGPFANADQAQKRCSALRKGGFDCVVQY
jgi:tetratricopeptide (TPR) repeat protein